MNNNIPKEIYSDLKKSCINELTESKIYDKISQLSKDETNKELFKKLSLSELAHHNVWKRYLKTDEKIQINKIKYYYYLTLIRVFGLSFWIKKMEYWEWTSVINYKHFIKYFPEAEKIIKDEEEHEKQIIEVINDNKLKYMSSIVLGLNDALVEITWALAWLTMTLENTKIVWISGLIIWISAAISMAASEFLSQENDEQTDVNPIKASIYTGIAYIFTVLALVWPYLIFTNKYTSLWLMLLNWIIIIALFNYYIAIAKWDSFIKRFTQMASISVWVAILSYFIWHLADKFIM